MHTGAKMWVHSASVKVKAGKGYVNVFMMVDVTHCQASCDGSAPALMLSRQASDFSKEMQVLEYMFHLGLDIL